MAEALTLADLRIDLLEIVCARCHRHGRYRPATLIAKHGPNMSLPDLRFVLAADCPRAGASAIADRCDVQFPQLVSTAE